DLDVGTLRARWHTMFRRRPSPHLPRHLLFRVLAYRLQADCFGDLDAESRRLLDGAGSPEDAGKRSAGAKRLTTELRPGAMLTREWNGRMQRVAVLTDGFAWNGKTYPSLSGFLAGVVRKRLKLKLSSKKVDGNRVYQIAGGDGGKAAPRPSKRRRS